MAWDGYVGHSCEKPSQHGVTGQLVYILCDGLSMRDLQLAAGLQSGRFEYADVLEFKLTVRENDNRIKERLTTMDLPETNVR